MLLFSVKILGLSSDANNMKDEGAFFGAKGSLSFFILLGPRFTLPLVGVALDPTVSTCCLVSERVGLGVVPGGPGTGLGDVPGGPETGLAEGADTSPELGLVEGGMNPLEDFGDTSFNVPGRAGLAKPLFIVSYVVFLF